MAEDIATETTRGLSRWQVGVWLGLVWAAAASIPIGALRVDDESGVAFFLAYG